MRIEKVKRIEIGVPEPAPRRRVPAPAPPPSRPAPVKEPDKVGAGSLEGCQVVSVAAGCPQCGSDLQYLTLEDLTTLVRCPTHGTLGGVQ